MKIRSRERLFGIFVTDGKNTEKNICKTYTHPPHRRLHKYAAESYYEGALQSHQ